MKKIALIFSLIFISNSVFAQNYILKSSLDSSVVEYAHIAFLGVKDGTYSNEKGEFTIPKNVDSIYISHISFENKLVSRKDFDKIIFLTASENALVSIEIRAKRNNFDSKIKLPKGSSRMGLNVSSFEMGTTFKHENKETDFHLTEIICPILKGIDDAILRINIYSFETENNRPDELVWSSVIEEDDFYKDKIALSTNIPLKKELTYFISLELLGYKQEGKATFVMYEKYKESLRLWMLEDKQNKCFIRIKHLQKDWFTYEKLDYMKYRVPIFWLEIE